MRRQLDEVAGTAAATLASTTWRTASRDRCRARAAWLMWARTGRAVVELVGQVEAEDLTGLGVDTGWRLLGPLRRSLLTLTPRGVEAVLPRSVLSPASRLRAAGPSLGGRPIPSGGCVLGGGRGPGFAVIDETNVDPSALSAAVAPPDRRAARIGASAAAASLAVSWREPSTSEATASANAFVTDGDQSPAYRRTGGAVRVSDWLGEGRHPSVRQHRQRLGRGHDVGDLAVGSDQPVTAPLGMQGAGRHRVAVPALDRLDSLPAARP